MCCLMLVDQLGIIDSKLSSTTSSTLISYELFFIVCSSLFTVVSSMLFCLRQLFDSLCFDHLVVPMHLSSNFNINLSNFVVYIHTT